MEQNTFTSGPIRPISEHEIGTSMFTDYTLLSNSGHNLVYRAMSSGRWWVLKAVKADDGAYARNLQLLQREFDIMYPLNCIYVVQSVQMVDDPKVGKAILMEYVDGRTMSEFLQENPSAKMRRQVLNELLEALSYLHHKGVVHGDLKPDNVLITTNGNHVRLIDFGFADNDAFVAKNIGTTQAFAAPEIMQGDAIDLAQLVSKDIYALGKLLQLLFPHRYLFVVHRCLKKNPQNRYHAVADVSRAVRRTSIYRWLLLIGSIVACLIGVGAYLWQSRMELLHEFVPTLSPATESVAETLFVSVPDVVSPPATIIKEMPPETIVQTVPTIVYMPMPDSINARRDSVLHAARREYDLLYATYKDSIRNVPDSSYKVAFDLHGRFCKSMYEIKQCYLTQYEEFADAIIADHMVVYDRTYTSLRLLFRDYYGELKL